MMNMLVAVVRFVPCLVALALLLIAAATGPAESMPAKNVYIVVTIALFATMAPSIVSAIQIVWLEQKLKALERR